MIRAAVVFFILALVAYGLGAYGLSGVSEEIGELFVIVFLVLAATSFMVSVFRGDRGKFPI